MNSIDFNLRDYTESDIPELVSTIKQAFLQYSGKLDPPSSAELKTIQVVQEELKSANSIVADVSEKIAGCVFYQLKDTKIYLDRLSVLPEYRKQGIATALMQEVERRAQTNGYEILTLSVRITLKEQQAFYTRLGYEFQEFGTHDDYNEPTYITMKKELGKHS